MATLEATSTPSKTKIFLYSIVLVAVLIAGYALTLYSYIQEGQNNTAPYVIGDDKVPDRVSVYSKIMSIDPVKGEMMVRFDVFPEGNLTETDGYSSTQNLIIFVNSANGQMERTFEAGKPINPFDVTLNLDGIVNDYPFDRYDGALIVSASAKGSEADAQEEAVPVYMELKANIPGFSIGAANNKESTADAPVVDLSVTRSSTVISVAVIGMLIMWAIAIAVIFLTFTYVFGNRKPEAFAFYSGLLFGLFGLRNSLPGTPPIGTQSDFLSFLWVEAIVAVMMVLTIAISLRRPQK